MNLNYTRIWLLLAFTLVILSLSSCNSQPPVVTVEEAMGEDHGNVPVQQDTDGSGPTDWEAIGRTLGCVFAPETCK